MMRRRLKMAFDLEKEEAKYREERARRFTNNAVNQESTVERDDGKTTQIIDESAGTPFSETFMWSAFFGGPIISYLAHLSEIRRSRKSYFWVVFGICLVPRVVVQGINRAVEHAADKFIVNMNNVDIAYYACCALETLLIVAFNLFMAFVAAQRFGKICPYCDADKYNKMERNGVIAGAVFWLILCTLNFFRSMG